MISLLTISVLQAYCAVTTQYGIPSDFVRKSTASLQIKISAAQLYFSYTNVIRSVLRLVWPLISSLVMSMMISGGLMVCPAEIVSAASSHPPVCPCAISSPQEGGSIGSEAHSEHSSTPRTCVHSTTLAHPSTPPAASGCLGMCLPATSTR